MTPISALVFYSLFLIVAAWVVHQTSSPLFLVCISLVGFLPFYPKVMNGELVERIESQAAIVHESQIQYDANRSDTVLSD